MAAAVVFATFLEQDGPQDAKTGGDGEQFRLFERSELFKIPFRVFRVFRGSLSIPPPVLLSQPLETYKFCYREKAGLFRQPEEACAYLRGDD